MISNQRVASEGTSCEDSTPRSSAPRRAGFESTSGTSQTAPVVGTATTTYTLNGDPVKETDYEGNESVYEYDLLNRVTKETRRATSSGDLVTEFRGRGDDDRIVAVTDYALPDEVETLRLDGLELLTVDLSGASTATADSATEVEGDLSGASDLTVPSDAAVDVDTSGASEVRRK